MDVARWRQIAIIIPIDRWYMQGIGSKFLVDVSAPDDNVKGDMIDDGQSKYHRFRPRLR